MSAPPEQRQPDVDAVASAASSAAGVVRLVSGPAAAVATYLPGRRVSGVRITDDAVEVHVIAEYGPTVDEVADAVRAALRPVTGGRTVHVVVADLVIPGEDDGDHDDEDGGAAPDDPELAARDPLDAAVVAALPPGRVGD